MALLQSLVNFFSFEAIQKGLSLRLNCSQLQTGDSGDFIVKQDKAKIKQMLTILICNALKFTSAGFIEVVASLAEGKTLRLEVKDTGPGIDQSI